MRERSIDVGRLLSKLSDRVVTRDLAGGDYAHREGDYAETVSFVLRGQLMVETYPPGSWAPQPVRLVGPDGLVGEEALVDGVGERRSTVRALCESRLAVVYRDDLVTELQRSVASTRTMLAVLAQCVRVAESGVLTSVQGSAVERVGRLLLVADGHLSHEPGGTLHLTQHDLAALSGVQRPTANKVLKELEMAQLIELRRSRLRVLDSAGLESHLAG